MSAQRLDVWCFGAKAGTLVDDERGMAFTYDDEWLAAGRPPLSQSLPTDAELDPAAVAAFFGGLLPEGEPRELLARQLGISRQNDFALLAQLGGDTAGAISVLPPGGTPPPAGTDVEWLDERQLAELIAELPTRPMHADPDREYRLSLAGVQDKLPVIVGSDGRVGLTKGGTPSTHILKTAIPRLPDTIVNEAFCLALARRLGLDVVTAEPRRALDQACLLVERYDRRATPDGAIERLHQEDFCQALGVPTARKYEAEGGPSLADCFALLRRASLVFAVDGPRMLDAVGLSFLVGNHDAHGKNYSLLYVPERSRAQLAPLYDVLSTIVYRDVRPMSRKMAMKIGGEHRPDHVRGRHLDRLCDGAGLSIPPSRRRLRRLASDAVRAAAETHAELAATGWDAEVLSGIERVTAQRADWLTQITATASGRGKPARAS